MKMQEVKRVAELTARYPLLNDDEIKELQLLTNNLSKFLAEVIKL